MILDSTLREGEQRFGVYFGLETKIEILRRLKSLGIEEVELGVVGCEEVSFLIRESRKKGIKASLWARLREDDLREAESLGPERINLGLPISSGHLRKRLGLKPQEALKTIRRLISRAKESFVYVSLGLEDASQSEPDLLLEAAWTAQEAGAQRIRISDTLGILNPLEVAALVSWLKENITDLELAFHGHNDFGQATANAIAALESGAEWVDVAVLGLGERAGIAALEEVLAYLYFRRGQRQYRLKKLAELCRFVAWHANQPIPDHKAIVGRGLFLCETGLHVHGLCQDPRLYEPFPPGAIGLRRHLALGKKSGRAAVRLKLRQMGISVSDGELETIVQAIRQASRHQNRPLTEMEIQEIIKDQLRWKEKIFTKM
ncbi:LeuA family protein [Thermosulfuriphilus sp.]